jgi:hypothetical protein
MFENGRRRGVFGVLEVRFLHGEENGRRCQARFD